MDNKLTVFLKRNHVYPDTLARLAATGASTVEEAWERADTGDLIWAVTRPNVMNEEQRQQFLAEAVLAPIEHLLTDARSKNILRKLRLNDPVTAADEYEAAKAALEAMRNANAKRRAAWKAAQNALVCAGHSDDAGAASQTANAACATSWASSAARNAANAAVNSRYSTRALDVADTTLSAAWDAKWAIPSARHEQADWVRKNLRVDELHIGEEVVNAD